MISINRSPSRNDLLWFGALLGVFAVVLGVMLWWRANLTWALVVAGAMALLDLVYFAAPPLRRPIYIAWMTIVFPIGFVVSHVMLAVVYYGVITPFGLVMRLFGRDPMHKRFDPNAASYWIEHRPDAHPERYYRQF